MIQLDGKGNYPDEFKRDAVALHQAHRGCNKVCIKPGMLLASPRYQVHPELESDLFDPDSVDAAGHRGVGAPADGSVLGRRAVAQG
jgi:hypothetical protein